MTCFQRGCAFIEYQNERILTYSGKEYTITRRIETEHGVKLSNVMLIESTRERYAIIHNHGG